MEFGLMLWTFGDRATPEGFRTIGETADRVGFDAVLAGDHITFPSEMPDEYPFGSGTPPVDADDNCYDVFQVLSHVSAVTENVRVGTNMVVVPIRHPVTLAKQALSLESISDGRFDFGVSVGWLDTEFEVLDVPFEKRGQLLDEFLEIYTRARSQGTLAFDGEYHSFQETGFYPIPDEESRAPIWLGGTSGPALRRLGQYGDGVVSVWDHPNEVRTLRERCERAWADFDRSGEPAIGVMRPITVGSGPGVDSEKLLQGPPDSIIDDLTAYEEAGTDRLVFEFFVEDVESQVEQLERIGSEIIPSFSSN